MSLRYRLECNSGRLVRVKVTDLLFSPRSLSAKHCAIDSSHTTSPVLMGRLLLTYFPDDKLKLKGTKALTKARWLKLRRAVTHPEPALSLWT